MRRTDAFMLGLTLFVLANCASYFVISQTPAVTRWGLPGSAFFWHESMGVPFEMFQLCLGHVGFFSCVPLNSLGNVAAACEVSWLFSISLASQLSPLWQRPGRAFRFSLRGLLVLIGLACLLLGLGAISPACGLLTRNVVCLAGPVGVFVWLWYRQELSWIRVICAAVGLLLIALALDVRYHDPPIDRQLFSEAFQWMHDEDFFERIAQIVSARRVVLITAARALVPVFGLLALLVTVQIVLEQVTLFRQRSGSVSERDPVGQVEAEQGLGG